MKFIFLEVLFSWRFSSATETKLNADIKLIEKIKNNEEFDFSKEINMENESKEYFKDLLKEDFSSGNAFNKAVLCILAYAEPKKFNDNSKVRLDNSWLSISTSKNYHHFFPKAFLKKQKNDKFANALANITIIDDYLNKNLIKAKSPKDYITEFRKENSNISQTLKSHFIDLESFGILENDYDIFLDKRADLLAKEILEKITNKT